MTILRALSVGLGTIVLGFFLLGCGEKATDSSEPRPIQGELAKAYEDILAADYGEACDRQDSEKKLEILRLLDQKREEIRWWEDSESAYSGQVVTRVGPGLFVLPPPVSPGQDEWLTRTRSWNKVFERHETYLQNPTPNHLTLLNSEARSILLDDQWRVVDEANLCIRHGDGPSLRALLPHLETCAQDPSCRVPNLPQDLMRFVENNCDLYDYHWRPLTTKELNASQLKRRKEAFQRSVTYTLRRFEFRRNESISRNSATEFVLKLQAGDFDGHEANLTPWIEDVWSSASFKVRVLFEKSPLHFAFRYFDIPGERAYVDRKEKTINLFIREEPLTVAHEIGHVLGFGDMYFPVWDPVRCVYETEYNPGNIMSSHTGRVTPEMWQELDRQYPKQP